MATRDMEKLVIGENTYVVRDNDALHVDDEHVVKSGSQVISPGVNWYYREWLSGTKECWATIPFPVTSWSSWGSMYYTNYFSQTYPTQLGFTTTPVLTWSASGEGNSSDIASVGSRGTGSSTSTPTLFLMRPTSGATGDYYINLYAIGR